MSVKTVDSIISNISLLLVLSWAAISWFQRLAVSGSHKKYVLSNAGIVITVSLVVADLIRGVFAIMDENYFAAGTWVAISVLYVWLSRDFFNDDNWFNNQYKRFKKSLKRSFENLSNRISTILSPHPSPA